MDCLNEVTLDHGWTLLEYDQVDSTNRMLVELAKVGASEGTCLSTQHQTNGRGRLGRTWTDLPGSSILFSILVRPSFSIENYFAVPCALSVALVETLVDLGLNARIKWPNDLLIGSAKLAGMLSEIGDKPDDRFFVIGLGINVNQSEDELIELGRPATSIRANLGYWVGHDKAHDILLKLIARFQQFYLELQASIESSMALFLERYKSYCSTINQFVSVELNDNEAVRGIATDITGMGHLVVNTENGIRTFAAGEVYHLYGY